jgi:hypothetical protein
LEVRHIGINSAVTTFVDFTPSATQSFQFSPMLDGKQYTLVVTWGLAGQRWYMNLYDQTGVLVVFIPLVGSPDNLETTSLTWDGTAKLVTVTTDMPHGVLIGTVVVLTITNVIPDTFNGVWSLVSTGPSTLTFQLVTNPGGPATSQGNIGRDMNLVAGYFSVSTLVFRQTTQQFEVTP